MSHGIFQTFTGQFYVVCTDAGFPATQGNPTLCLVSGLLTHFGILFIGYAWTAVAIHSAVAVLLRRENIFNWKTMIITYTAVLGIPIIMVIIVASNGAYSARPTVPFCFITPTDYAWGTYYAHQAFLCLVSLVSISIVVYKTFRAGQSDPVWGIRANARVIVFLLIGIVFLVFNVAQRAWVEEDQDSWKAQFAAWGGCAQQAITASACVRPPMVDGVTNWTLFFFIFSPSITLVLFFGTNKELWTDWTNRVAPWQGITAATSTTMATTTIATSNTIGSKTETNFMSDLQ